MQVTFVGGPWHGGARHYPDPLPPRIGAPDGATYVPWNAHPSTPGVRADLLDRPGVYVLGTLEARELLKRIEDILLHGMDCAGRPGMKTGGAVPPGHAADASGPAGCGAPSTRPGIGAEAICHPLNRTNLPTRANL